MDVRGPTIAAVEGAVRAGGVGLMASCDLVVVQPDVTFALHRGPHRRRRGDHLGADPAPGARRQDRRGDPHRRAFDAAEARDIGLVTHVTDDVAATVAELCDGIRAERHAPSPRRSGCSTGRRASTARLRSTEMRALSDELFRGPDAAEGMAAFREKRSPTWPT